MTIISVFGTIPVQVCVGSGIVCGADRAAAGATAECGAEAHHRGWTGLREAVLHRIGAGHSPARWVQAAFAARR